MQVIWKGVPMFEKGRKEPILGVCIHIAEGTKEQVLSTFRTEEKSSHYLVSKEGEVWQFVLEENTAWGQGIKVNPSAQLVLDRTDKNPNSYLISIEHEGRDDITESQYNASAELLYDVCSRWKIPLDRTHIIRHNEINKGKTCPAKISVEKLIEIAKTFEPKLPEEKSPPWFKTFLLGLIDYLQSFIKKFGRK